MTENNCDFHQEPGVGNAVNVSQRIEEANVPPEDPKPKNNDNRVSITLYPLLYPLHHTFESLQSMHEFRKHILFVMFVTNVYYIAALNYLFSIKNQSMCSLVIR